MDESINMNSDDIGKSDDSKKCISQKSANFSIDSLLATTEKVQHRTTLNANDDEQGLNFKFVSQTENSNSDCDQCSNHGRCSDQSSAEECAKKEVEMNLTTEGFYHRKLSDGKCFFHFYYFF